MSNNRIQALLDAFLAAELTNAHLFVHEHDVGEAESVIEWAKTHKIRIATSINTGHGRTYENWEIRVGASEFSFFPMKMGLLDNVEDLKKKIAQIRAEADARIRELVEAEKARAS